MSAKDAHLYRPAASKLTQPFNKNPTDTTFSSTFSSLLADAKNGTPVPKPRSTNSKHDIFKSSNKGAGKRVAADMLAHAQATGKIRDGDAEPLDDAEWQRTRRKMDEKARLYAALKRGDVDDKDDRYGVDFDRKWAERDERKGDSEQDDSDAADSDDAGSTVEYLDEMGRTRTGTRKDLRAEHRRRARQARAEELVHSESARPSVPHAMIYGDAIQAEAFDPDAAIAAKMSELAEKRDRAETPPLDEHYDASKEVRTKGTGFYHFSQEAETRKQQQKDLEEIRVETERARGEKHTERAVERGRRQEELEQRRKRIRDKKGKVMAARFLKGLGEEIGKATVTSEKEASTGESEGGE